MRSIRRVRLLAIAVLIVGCTAAPVATTEPATTQPSTEPSQAPPTLDPSLSDAGVIGRVTISEDARANRDGAHQIVGLAADGSSCSVSLEADEYTAVAWYDEAPNEMIHQMAVTVAASDIPEADGGVTSDITHGRVYIDFVSASGFGTAYSGDATEANEGSVTVSVMRVGEGLLFDYQGVTWDDVGFSGQLVCGEG